MNEIITCHVARDHITKGVRGDNSYCPIALALREQFPGPEIISVGMNGLTVNGNRYELSSTAEKFIRAFDIGQIVSPAMFRFRRIA